MIHESDPAEPTSYRFVFDVHSFGQIERVINGRCPKLMLSGHCESFGLSQTMNSLGLHHWTFERWLLVISSMENGAI